MSINNNAMQQLTLIGAKKKEKYYIYTQDQLNPIKSNKWAALYKGHVTTNILVAIKQLKISITNSKQIERHISILNQISLFKDTSHIAQIYDYCNNSGYEYIIMPYYDAGSLAALLTQVRFTELESLELMRQLCFGLHILHQHQILHRDIKCSNIFAHKFDDPQNLYKLKYLLFIGDFSTAKELTQIDQTPLIGSQATRAPEASTGVYSYSSDIYSLGCVFYRIINDVEPFYSSIPSEIDANKLSPILNCPNLLSQKSMALLRGCLAFDPKERLTLDQIDNIISFKTIYTHYNEIEIGSMYSTKTLMLQKSSNTEIEKIRSNIQKNTINLALLKQFINKIREYNPDNSILSDTFDPKVPLASKAIIDCVNKISKHSRECNDNAAGVLQNWYKCFMELKQIQNQNNDAPNNVSPTTIKACDQQITQIAQSIKNSFSSK